ncbi:hypothetical protein FBF28_01235 [Candidatus Saccharibacteria bacterium oral taxon 488]|nr:hypothetical protein FBF28_01235 [Candidatus Saccharibacteria bacterium oral taxon 488]
MGEKYAQRHNITGDILADSPDLTPPQASIGNLVRRLETIVGNPELTPEQKLTEFWQNFNTLTDYPPDLDNRIYWLMDIQKLLIGASFLEKLPETSADKSIIGDATPETLRERAAVAFEQYCTSFDSIAPSNTPSLPSSRLFESVWRATKSQQPSPTAPEICIAPALREIVNEKEASSLARLWLQKSSHLSDVQAVFDYAHQQIDKEQKVALLSVVGERVAKMLVDAKTTLFTGFLRLRAAQIAHDLAELGHYSEEESINRRADAIIKLSELATSLENNTQYSVMEPGVAKNLYEKAEYFYSLYSNEQEELTSGAPPTRLADRLGTVAVEHTTPPHAA